MPEDAEREAPRGVLDRLDRPVFRVRGLDKTLAEPIEALVVMRLDRRPLTQQTL